MRITLSPKGKGNWIVEEKFSIYSKTVKGIIVVPSGFITDLASIPRFLWAICPPFGRYTTAAVVHDYLYRNGMYTRKKCDKVFKEIMKEYNVSKWKVSVFYSFVRVCGKGSFGGKKWKDK